MTAPRARPGLVTYPFPLRSGADGPVMAWLHLPADLTAEEVGRLQRFVAGLATEPIVIPPRIGLSKAEP